jgi:hypothetical protein
MWVCQQCHYPIFDTVASFKMHPASFFYLLHTRWWLSTLSCAGWAFVPTLTLLWSQLLPDSRELAVVDEAVVSFKLHPISFLYIVCIYTVCSTLSCSEWPYGCTLTPLLSQTFPLIWESWVKPWAWVIVIGHGIVGKDIPIMACLAKARRWSKRWQTCLSSPDLTATQISDGSKIQVRWRHVLRKDPTKILGRESYEILVMNLGCAYAEDTLQQISESPRDANLRIFYEIHMGKRIS